PNVYSAGVAQGAPDVSRAVLNHRERVGLSTSASPTRLGRLPVPVLATGLASDGVNGSPVWKIRIRLTCQLPNALLTQLCEEWNRLPVPNGKSYSAVCVQRCRMSKLLLPPSRNGTRGSCGAG